MCSVVLQVLDLDTDHGFGRRSVVIVVRILDGKEVRREGRVQGVGQQDELERDLLLQLDRDGICLLKDYRIIDYEMKIRVLLQTFRKTALPQRSSLREVNW